MNRPLASLSYRMSPSVMALLFGVTGCSAAVDDPIGEPVVETHSQLLSDPSGNITVAFSNSGGSYSGPVAGTTKGGAPYFNDQWVLIGGGGGVSGEPNPGAFLQESHPAADFFGQFWAISIVTHLHPAQFSYTMTGIALQLRGVEPAALRAMVTVTQATGPAGRKSTATAFAPAGHVVLGGGATAPSAGNQQVLVASVPHFGPDSFMDGWTAISKDHGNTQVGSVISYVVSIPRCPTGFAGGCLVARAIGHASSFGNGYRSASEVGSIAVDGVVTGVGAQAFYSGAGRLLTDMAITEFPSTGQYVLVTDAKDLDSSDSGQTIGWMIVLKTTPQ